MKNDIWEYKKRTVWWRGKNYNAFSGFTLIELLVVIGVIGVLASSLLIVIKPSAQIAKAHDAQRKSDLKQLQNALESYYNDNNKYPADIKPEYLNSSYINKIPVDPLDPKLIYLYNPLPNNTNAQKYVIYAHLEAKDDPQLCNGGLTCTNVPGDDVCGYSGEVCNYGVSSPNTTP